MTNHFSRDPIIKEHHSKAGEVIQQVGLHGRELLSTSRGGRERTIRWSASQYERHHHHLLLNRWKRRRAVIDRPDRQGALKIKPLNEVC